MLNEFAKWTFWSNQKFSGLDDPGAKQEIVQHVLIPKGSRHLKRVNSKVVIQDNTKSGFDYLSTRLAKGWTVSEVPMMMRRLHSLKSFEAFSKTFRGSPSPKKTMSGLTTLLQRSQVGITSSSNSLSENRAKKNETWSLLVTAEAKLAKNWVNLVAVGGTQGQWRISSISRVPYIDKTLPNHFFGHLSNFLVDVACHPGHFEEGNY